MDLILSPRRPAFSIRSATSKLGGQFLGNLLFCTNLFYLIDDNDILKSLHARSFLIAPLADRDSRSPTATKSLRSQDLIIIRTSLQPQVIPRGEMVCGGDSPTSTLVLTNRPVLVEGGGALDGWLVNSCVLVDVIDGTVACYGAFVCCARRGVVVVPRFSDVLGCV